jgi:hypothetical protein
METEKKKTGGIVASWSTHHIGVGSDIRYFLDPDDDAPVQLLIGEHEQINLGLPLSEVASIITTLQAAEREVEARAAVDREAPKS